MFRRISSFHTDLPSPPQMENSLHFLMSSNKIGKKKKENESS
jgi:hypothetical protein